MKIFYDLNDQFVVEKKIKGQIRYTLRKT